ncbi:hypothetical protein BK635_13090 [Pseudomonas chlororaphis]|uniref:hypothetical protein n=1 Tax=Pseudomonas chlororaphis TaxID=587753 RepID=UPI000F49AC52|nr:hypothetical protein [Pseudomonas chlororaphis]RON82431.1 hypothetical protein BK635_13090 [Pseudomonas chlororaphis]
MKVKDLIEELQKLDPNLQILAACEDEGVVVPGYFVRPFEVTDASAASVEIDWDDEGRRTMCAVPAEDGQQFAIIEITSIF